MPHLPWWVLECRLERVVGTECECGLCEDSDLIEQAADLVVKLTELQQRIEDTTPHPEIASSANSLTGASVLATARLLVGACCELHAAQKCRSLVTPGFRNRSVAMCQLARRLYQDSALIAAWTSAHAHYVHDLMNQGMAIAFPSIHSVPCEAGEMDLSDLYSRRYDPSTCKSKDSEAMLSLMSRCTNPGARGWDSMISGSLYEFSGTKRLCATALVISLTGMNSAVHPHLRPNWSERMKLTAHLNAKNLFNTIAPMCKCPLAFKECIRRMVSSCLSGSLATNAALFRLEHPVAFLAGNVHDLPPEGLECSATAFMEAGKAILSSGCTRDIVECVSSIVGTSVFSQMTSVTHTETALVWNSAYLGKGTASTHHKVPATSVATSVWTAAFKCNFMPFWAHCWTHNVRATRMDASQYASIHGINSCRRLTLLLNDDELLAIQRTALSKSYSGLMTLEEVAEGLGIVNVRGSSCNGGTKGVMDAVNIIAESGGLNAATILHFCKVSMLSESILIYDLGEKTATLQKRALVKRLLVDELYKDVSMSLDELAAMLPDHARKLCACIECKRVSSAVATDAGQKWKACFNEIGTSKSMMAVDSDTGEVNLRCAKRSSASLKTAIASEDSMRVSMLECEPCNYEEVNVLLTGKSGAASSGASSKARRDAKCSLAQRRVAVACGSEPMLSVDLVGRAVRLWNEWYALCSYCGCFVRFSPSNRYGPEICCMRCDFKLLNRNSNAHATQGPATRAPHCRYCGKVRSSSTPFPCLSPRALRFALARTGRPSALRSALEDGQISTGRIRRKRRASSSSSLCKLLPKPLPNVDTRVCTVHSNPELRANGKLFRGLRCFGHCRWTA